MRNWLKLSHHEHSGRLRPHETTSYAPLALLLVAVGLTLTVCTVSAATPGPASSSVSLTGTMPGSPPKTAATITTPHAGQHFGTSPITVAGSCPANTLVEVYKNDIFAGSTICTSSGSYSLDVDLLVGQNVLVARVYDSLNQPGPDSNSVTVFYDVLPTQSAALNPLSFGGAQLLLVTDAVYRGVFPQHELTVPITILGGSPPYAVNVTWGDGKSQIIPRANNEPFNASHTYAKSGNFAITLQGTDSVGRVAYISVAAIVNGQPTVLPASSTKKLFTNKLLLLWPLYTSAAAVTASFWLGERREKHLLAKMYTFSA
jgi:hypothetical protein